MASDMNINARNLPETLSQLEDQIRSDPANAKHRIFLFQLLAILERWDRALNQLNVLQDLDSATGPMVATYREAIQNEALRNEIFAGNRSPVIFGEPEEWIAQLLESLRLVAEEKYAPAEAMRAKAFDLAPTTSGTIDGQPFEWIADADSRLGPVIEVLINGRYTWVPFHRVSRIDIEAPEDLRDLVWLPGHFTWANGGEMVGLIPTRYPGAAATDDGDLMLARKTQWAEASAETFLGQGQRILTTDTGEYPIMDIRRIDLNSAATSGPAASAQDSEDA